MTRPKLVHALAAIALASLTTEGHAGSENIELHMIHSMKESLTSGSESIGVFTREGPKKSTLRKAPRRVDFIAYDAKTGTYYGQQTSSIGTIEPSGKLTKVELPESVDLSHSGGLAFDDVQRNLLVASSSGAGTVVFEYGVDTNQWNEIGNLGRGQLQGLACNGAEELIYVLERPVHEHACTKLLVFNHNGAQIEAVPLSEPIPFYMGLHPKVQLAFENGFVYALISQYLHPRAANALYRIDPDRGQVTREPYNTTLDLTTKTWPGWKEGPSPSISISAGGARGSGYYSNYRTPDTLVARQSTELHVVAIDGGAMSYMQWLKKVKKVRASASGGTVSLELELDLEAEGRHPVVEVAVNRTKKPMTLVLMSSATVNWSIEPAPDARIEKVILFSPPFVTASRVLGVDESLVADGGGNLHAVPAWELDQGLRPIDFDEMIATLRQETGLRENSFQGLGQAERFTVPLPVSKVAGAR
jgi:hypothetical protein